MNRTNLGLGRFLVEALPSLSRTDALSIQRAIVALGCCLVGYRAYQLGRAGFERCFSALLLLMVLAAPVIWFNHLLWCAIPIVISWKATRGCPISRITVALSALAITASRFIDMYLQVKGAAGALPGALLLTASSLALIIILCRPRPAL